ncbi:MAG TPA: PAS domain S-box protein [Candidatus Limnocylindria bacterium]|nr:PAS domain S-box protein [Candidatus Limnocylindria bacterium]
MSEPMTTEAGDRTDPGPGSGDGQFRALVGQAQELVIVLNAEGKFLYGSPAIERVFGFRPGEAAGRAGLDIVHPDDDAIIQEAHARALRNPGVAIQIRACRAADPDGQAVWLEATGTSLLHDPAVGGVVVNLREITTPKDATARLRRSEAATRTINEFAASLSALHTEDDILWDITRLCIARLGFEDCVIYLLDADRGVLVQKAAYGPKNPHGREILSPIEIPLGHGVVGAAAETGTAELVPDTRLDPRYIVDDAPRRSELAVAIVAEGQVLGVIDSEHSVAGFFTEEHRGILRAIASICANKLVRARAERQLRELNADLERRIAERTEALVAANDQLKREITERVRAERMQKALLEISEAVHTVADLPSLYLRIHEIIGMLMRARSFYLALYEPATDTVSFPYYSDDHDPPPPTRQARRGITEYVLRLGRPLLATQKEIQELIAAGECVPIGRPAAVWLGVPLTVDGGTYGVMAVQDQHDATVYGEEEKRLLSFVAGQTALAIERKRAEAELLASTQRMRESEERFSKAFRAIPANVSLVRVSDERLIEVNEAFVKESGYTRAEAIGHTTAELSLWADPAARVEFFKLLRKQGFVHSFESDLRGRHGDVGTMLISAELIELKGEKCILALALSIEERKRAEEELLRSVARERELSRLKSSFVSLVSHEFRTPIGIIHSSAEILERYQERLPAAERTEHLRAIQSHAWRMASLMEEVLLFGKVEAGRLEFRTAEFDLDEACRRWVQELTLATDRRCPIHLTLGELPTVKHGDADLLRHICSNLLSNAVKYSAAGSPVEFQVERDENDAVFIVRDHGLGIPEADRARLFTAFQRGSNVRHLPGTGLGMVVIRHCLDLHRGTIELDSHEGAGTTFTVRVPLFDPSST